MKLLGLGDNVCDLYLHTKMMYPGGQVLNVAVNAARLGVWAEYLGVFGTDSMARHVQSVLDVEGVKHSRCRIFPGENGFAKVILKDGDRVFLGSNRGGVLQKHPIILDCDDLDYCAQFQIIHTSNNSFMDQELKKLKFLPGLVSYDFSTHWTEEERLDQVCPNIDFAFLSGSELTLEQAESVANRLIERGNMVVCITRGEKDALLYDGNIWLVQPPCLVSAVDTMGAGDSFAACLLTRVGQALEMDGLSCWNNPLYRMELLRTALQAAAEWSAQSCLTSGGLGHGTAIPKEFLEKISS